MLGGEYSTAGGIGRTDETVRWDVQGLLLRDNWRLWGRRWRYESEEEEEEGEGEEGEEEKEKEQQEEGEGEGRQG
jgi:hypothetical protein